MRKWGWPRFGCADHLILTTCLTLRGCGKEMRSLITHQTKQICETTEQMLKNAFNDALGSISLQTAREVKDVAIEARNNSTHVDEKFWEDILGSIDRKILNSHDGDMYEDPLTCELFIDPVVASNGETYCRWTLIDKKVSKNPFDQTEALTILCDNLEKRRHLLREFPAQFEIFQRRRKDFRDHALAMAREGVWLADAIVGLEHVLKWDKKDKECKEALDQVRNLALQETTRQQQPVAVTWSYEQLYPVDYSPAQTARVHFGTGPSSSNVGSWHQVLTRIFYLKIFQRDVLLDSTFNTSPEPYLQKVLLCRHSCHTWNLGSRVKW